MTEDALTLPLPLARAARKPAMPKWPRLVTGLMVAAALAAAISFPLRDNDRLMAREQAPAAQPPKPQWIDIAKPYPLYTLEAPELARLPRILEARRLATGPGRWDSLTLGSFAAGNGTWMRLDIQRFGRNGLPETGFFIDVARHAAEAGLAVSRSDAPARIASRFGGMDYAAVVLARGPLQARCEAFRFGDLGPDLSISGIFCAAPGKTQEPGGLVCLLDHLGLAGGGEDAALRKIFVAAELRRDAYCYGGKYVSPELAAIASASVSQLPKTRK